MRGVIKLAIGALCECKSLHAIKIIMEAIDLCWAKEFDYMTHAHAIKDHNCTFFFDL